MDESNDITSDPLIARVSATLRQSVPVSAGFDDRVMREIRAETRDSAPSPVARARRFWLLEPRTYRVRPIVAIAASAAIIAISLAVPPVVSRMTERAAPPLLSTVVAQAAASSATLSPASSGTGQSVRFVLVAPGARDVSVAGSFNDWDAKATPLVHSGSGSVWSTVVPLRPGRYTYTFVIDGTRWIADPAAPRAVDNDFGTPSSVLTVRMAP